VFSLQTQVLFTTCFFCLFSCTGGGSAGGGVVVGLWCCCFLFVFVGGWRGFCLFFVYVGLGVCFYPCAGPGWGGCCGWEEILSVGFFLFGVGVRWLGGSVFVFLFFVLWSCVSLGFFVFFVFWLFSWCSVRRRRSFLSSSLAPRSTPHRFHPLRSPEPSEISFLSPFLLTLE